MSSRGTIAVDQFLPHAPTKVWRALTNPGRLAAWFMPNDFSPAVGHTFSFHRKPNSDAHFSETVRCVVLAVDEPRLLSYSWTDGGEYAGELDSVVTWTLRPEGHGTRLFLEHRGFSPDDPIHRIAIDLMTGGWHLLLAERLPAALQRTDTTDSTATDNTATATADNDHVDDDEQGAHR